MTVAADAAASSADGLALADHLGWEHFSVIGISFGGIPSLVQARMLQSASLRLRDTASAWLTISFNIAIAGGAFVGGVVLDRLSLDALPWVLVATVAVTLVWVLSTDRVRIRRAAHP